MSEKTIRHAYTVFQAEWNYAQIYLSAHNKIILPVFPGKMVKLPRLNNQKTCWLERDKAYALIKSCTIGVNAASSIGPLKWTRKYSSWDIDLYNLKGYIFNAGRKTPDMEKSKHHHNLPTIQSLPGKMPSGWLESRCGMP